MPDTLAGPVPWLLLAFSSSLQLMMIGPGQRGRRMHGGAPKALN